MPSSTSSSEWLKTWILALAIAVGVLSGWEIFLRATGHEPTIVDSPCLWSHWRNQVVGDKVMVILGDSRPQLGFSTQVARSILPDYKVIQLAIDGTSSPAAVLADLSVDTRFRGVVLVCSSERGFYRSNWNDQSAYVRYYRRQYGLNSDVNVRISCWFHERFVMLDPRLKLDNLLMHMGKHRAFPGRFYVTGKMDRSLVADYSGVDLGSVLSGPPSRVLPDMTSLDDWLKDTGDLERYVSQIQSRGGSVAYVRFPSSGRIAKREEEIWPKATFWDALACRTEAACLHFRDYTELSCYNCPDEVHLDCKDAPEFTRHLLAVLQSHGVFERRGNQAISRTNAPAKFAAN